MLNKVHHIAIICSNYEISKKFYLEVLGLEIIQEVYREERDSYKLDLALNGEYIIELFSFPNPPKRVSRPEAAGLRHLCFEVEDIEKEVEIIRRKEVNTEEIRIDEIIATGGVAKKSPFIMQILANVMNKPIKVARSLQTVARGAAIFAAVQSGIYKTAEEAQQYMLDEFEKEYFPEPEKVAIYEELFREYEKVGNFLEKEVYDK